MPVVDDEAKEAQVSVGDGGSERRTMIRILPTTNGAKLTVKVQRGIWRKKGMPGLESRAGPWPALVGALRRAKGAEGEVGE